MTVTMAGMSSFSLRHDVKLGLLLVVSALLLDMGSSGGSWFSSVFEQLHRTAGSLGLLGPVVGLGSTFVVVWQPSGWTAALPTG